MKHYIIGDLHGCYDELQTLLQTANVDISKDELWFTGDLIGRGPKPLETLRFIRSLDAKAQVVLGNHDIHCLAVASGIARNKSRDQLTSLLDAPDSHELLEWLWQQPLLAQLAPNAVMVHAGITPQWTFEQAIEYADEVHQIFCDPQLRQTLIAHIYGDQPNKWHHELTGIERYRFIINSLTRMRFCYDDYRLDFAYKGALSSAPDQLTPWFKLRQDNLTILFGHWAALMGKTADPRYIGLDTGCIWGNELTMLEWETAQFYRTPSQLTPI